LARRNYRGNTVTLRIDEHPPPDCGDPALYRVVSANDGRHVLLVFGEQLVARWEWRTAERLGLDIRRTLAQMRPVTRAADGTCRACGGSGRVMDAPTGPGSYGERRDCVCKGGEAKP
jgi:hypothetical protein